MYDLPVLQKWSIRVCSNVVQIMKCLTGMNFSFMIERRPMSTKIKHQNLPKELHTVQHWIFDMDGTLTHAIHDFAGIKRTLGLPPEPSILESIATYPAEEAKRLHQELQDLEWDLAHQATPQPGAMELLEALAAQGAKLGILTRNSRKNALATLKVCNFLQFFEEPVILGRDSAPAKPEPDGILQIVEHWGAEPSQAAMVGDYLYDLQAGKNAGATTVYIDIPRALTWQEWADVTVHHLDALLQQIISSR
mgnify:CR=1 FL=1